MNKWYYKLILSGVIISILFASFDFNVLKSIDINFSLFQFFTLFLLLLCSLLLRSYRWAMLMNDEECNISQLDSFKLLLVGSSLNIFLPSGAGDVAKSYYGYKWTGIKERMISISLIDKLIAIGSLLFITPFCFYISQNSMILIAGILSILPFLLIFYFSHILKINFIKRFYDIISSKSKKINLNFIVKNFNISYFTIFFSFFLSVVAWILTYILLWFCFKIVGVNVPLFYVLSTIPFLTLGRLFPFTLNGIGSDEALMIYLFSKFSCSMEPILVGALIYRIVLILVPALIGLPLIYVHSKPHE